MVRYNKIVFISGLIIILSSCSTNKNNYFKNFPDEANSLTVGERLVRHYLNTPYTYFGNPYSGIAPTQITYPDVCTWLGSLWFARTSGSKDLFDSLSNCYKKLVVTQKQLLPEPNHVDNNVFGTIPLELYQTNPLVEYRESGLFYADKQWELPAYADSAQIALNIKGYSWQTRLWIDDMFMITILQSQAYRVTKNDKYINRMAKEMIYYLDNIQLPDGLFHHSVNAPYCWGRGNGWMAVGMTEILRILPKKNISYFRIMSSYKRMMQTLLKKQKGDGLWGQLINEPETWSESSGSAMFTYALIIGVKKGWLDKTVYGPATRKAWISLTKLINEKNDVTSVCIGTNMKDDHEYYLKRRKLTGDLHGQAPYIWCANALLQ